MKDKSKNWVESHSETIIISSVIFAITGLFVSISMPYLGYGLACIGILLFSIAHKD